MKNLTKISGLAAALAVAALPVLAQDAPAEAAAVSAVPTDTVWILNTLLFLIGGFLVFWMAAGFAMLEAGLVRSKNVAMQLLKNISLFAIACTMYYLIGYNLMYPLGNWTIGTDDTGGYLGAFAMAVLEAVGVGADAAAEFGLHHHRDARHLAGAVELRVERGQGGGEFVDLVLVVVVAAACGALALVRVPAAEIQRGVTQAQVEADGLRDGPQLLREVVVGPGRRQAGVALLADQAQCAVGGHRCRGQAGEVGFVVAVGDPGDRAAVAQPLGVQALGIHPMKTDKRDLGDINLTVTFARVDFIPGQFVYADNNGVLVATKQLV